MFGKVFNGTQKCTSWVWNKDAWCWFYILWEGGWIFVLQNLQMYGSVIGWRIQRRGSWTGLEKLGFLETDVGLTIWDVCDPRYHFSGWITIPARCWHRQFLLEIVFHFVWSQSTLQFILGLVFRPENERVNSTTIQPRVFLSRRCDVIPLKDNFTVVSSRKNKDRNYVLSIVRICCS